MKAERNAALFIATALIALALVLLACGAYAQTSTIQHPPARTIKVGTVYWAVDTNQVKTVFEVWDSNIICPIAYIHDTIRIHDTVYLGQPTLTSIFTTQTLPTTSSSDGNLPITLGVKFRPAIAAFAKGIRFYKTTNNTGFHIGYLYNLQGLLLDSGVFVNETASGWQTLTLTKNIQLTANTTYVAAYYSPSGQYSNTLHGFDAAIINGIITGLASGTVGVNGVYNYGNKFPTLTYQNSNYWVDCIISQTK